MSSTDASLYSITVEDPIVVRFQDATNLKSRKYHFFQGSKSKKCVFRMVALIGRRSKYDFWIPDKILTLEKKIQKKKLFFRGRKFRSKKNRKFFSIEIFDLEKKSFFSGFFFF